MNLTICYVTARKDPRISWFFESLWNEIIVQFKQRGPSASIIPRVVVADFYHDERPNLCDEFRTRAPFGTMEIVHVPQKPNVWNGASRLTNEDYFAMASARNGALCYCTDGWVAMIDDLSVLLPGWYDKAIRAIATDHMMTLGSYRKVKDLSVIDGKVKSFRVESETAGLDTRWSSGNDDHPILSAGHLMYGYVIGPVEAFLSINGYLENADGLGFEDVTTGCILENKGWKFLYDRTMMVWEDDELHGQPPGMRKADYGKSPNDKSHALLDFARKNDWSPNDFGGKTLRELRDEILCGAQFPIPRLPNVEWFSQVPLSEIRYAEYPDSLYR